MEFAIFGGDARLKCLPELLRERGHGVRTYALGLEEDMAPEAAARGIDCLILPLPCESGGHLNAPACPQPPTVDELLDVLDPGTLVCAGKASTAMTERCRRLGLRLVDYFKREDFTLRNAELTAEGALTLLLDAPIALNGSRALILGFGRIGRLLAGKLLALGADVTVGARSPEQRTLAEIMGCRAVGLEDIGGDYDFAVNTVPETLFALEAIESLDGARLIELASPPYGFDRASASVLGREIVLGSGLPGKTAPEAAGRAILDTVFNIIEGD